MEAKAFIERVREYLPSDAHLVEKAYEFAAMAHKGQTRKSGHPYLEHPLHTAMVLSDLKLDADTLSAALLHDVSEDCGTTLREIEAQFNPQVAKLVDGVTKINKITNQAEKENARSESQAENLRKMLLATTEDVRVLLIKLADRLDNMRTLGALTQDRRHAIALETLEIYAPLAHRLGMGKIKWQLEDLSFRYLEPQEYHRVARLVAGKREERESFVEEVSQLLEQELGKAGVKAKVSGRPKHIYSVYQKIGKYATQGKDFSDIHDLLALRVLTSSVSDCYKALGVVHSLWRPIMAEFNDFVANPKGNGYKSLHTTVMYKATQPLEIQIRTYEMHCTSEYGVAAHWRYKEGKESISPGRELGWLCWLGDWKEGLDSEDFLETVKSEVLSDSVFIYTPQGEIKELPKGATPLDFAFRIHTDLGYRCIGSKVNGKLEPLNHVLGNGDVVEIIASKENKGPSLDWRNPELGYVKTAHSKAKIRQWFKKQERSQCVANGRQIWDKELRHLGVSVPSLDKAGSLFGYVSQDDFLAALGSGSLKVSQVALKLSVDIEPPEEIVKTASPAKISPIGVKVMGVGGLLTRLANCCHPLPGDKIIGYITQGRGITVHCENCPNVVNEEERERLIQVEWGEVERVYPVTLQVEAWNRVGLVRDISAIIAGEGVNLTDVKVAHERGDNMTSEYFTIEVKNAAQLARIVARAYSVWNVISVTRKGEMDVKQEIG
ncbi:MAG: bifunctional (p)ppGpp synthetase/guanosine-3',5'-bis(diphosphate) 3'-pyrophosphohydrolase [Dehalococcoidia bacterium]|nr:bifunctional (p)ppGpp synthetase/guanosine-3',5'-bis(diphosphate) 3'-pyrophosphohydrolase [Dehalococcoidia bacterium]